MTYFLKNGQNHSIARKNHHLKPHCIKFMETVQISIVKQNPGNYFCDKIYLNMKTKK